MKKGGVPLSILCLFACLALVVSLSAAGCRRDDEEQVRQVLQALDPTGPELLPVATTSQVPLTAAYDTLNVPALPAGSYYLDPTTGVKIYKLTSATFPVAGANWYHDFSEGGDEVSLPYTGDGITRAVLVHKSAIDPYYLIDFTPGVGVSNPRQLTGNFAPVNDVAFTFSNNPNTPYYAYVSNGASIIRFDIRTMAEADGDGWPVVDANAVWLHQSENDGLFTWMRGRPGTVAVGYEPSTGTMKTYTNADLNQTRIDRAGRYIGLSVTLPAHGLVIWDWQTNTVLSTSPGDPGIPFNDSTAELEDLWVVVDSNLSSPGQFAMFTPGGPASGTELGGPAPADTVYGSGNWIQHPASGDPKDQWALFSYYGGLQPAGNGWLAPGGMILMTPNGQRRLLAHAYNTSAVYALSTFAKFSSDGKYVLFTSDMDGSGRSDVFLAEMPQ